MVATSFKSGKFINVPNHLDAIKKLGKKFSLHRIIDKNPSVIKFLKKKKLPVSKSILDIKIAKKNEIFIICTPSTDRLDIVKYLINIKAKNIIIEKPLSLSVKDGEKIKQLIKNNNINCFVNYHRRNINAIVSLKKEIQDCISINVNYNNGLFNYASHAIDIINFYFGKFKTIKSISSISSKKWKVDEALSFSGNLRKKIKVNFLAHDKVEYDLFDIELYCKKKKISLLIGGKLIKEEKIKKNLFFTGYTHLKEKKICCNDENGFDKFYENLYDFLLNRKKTNLCSIEDALYVVRVCNSVIQSKNKKGKIITI